MFPMSYISSVSVHLTHEIINFLQGRKAIYCLAQHLDFKDAQQILLEMYVYCSKIL